MCYDDNYDHKDNDDDDYHDDTGGDDYDNYDDDNDDDDRDNDDDDDQGGRVGSGSVELGWRDLRPGTVGKWEDTGSRYVFIVLFYFQFSIVMCHIFNCHMSHFNCHLSHGNSRQVGGYPVTMHHFICHLSRFPYCHNFPCHCQYF